MLDIRSAGRAADLRALLDSGSLRGLGRIDTLHGLSADAELATRIVLAHLDHLTDLEAAGTACSARRRAVEEDLERLYTGIKHARPGVSR